MSHIVEVVGGPNSKNAFQVEPMKNDIESHLRGDDRNVNKAVTQFSH